MSNSKLIAHPITEVLHRVEFDCGNPRITRKQRIDVYENDEHISTDTVYFWTLPSGQLHHVSSRTDARQESQA